MSTDTRPPFFDRCKTHERPWAVCAQAGFDGCAKVPDGICPTCGAFAEGPHVSGCSETTHSHGPETHFHDPPHVCGGIDPSLGCEKPGHPDTPTIVSVSYVTLAPFVCTVGPKGRTYEPVDPIELEAVDHAPTILYSDGNELELDPAASDGDFYDFVERYAGEKWRPTPTDCRVDGCQSPPAWVEVRSRFHKERRGLYCDDHGLDRMSIAGTQVSYERLTA